MKSNRTMLVIRESARDLHPLAGTDEVRAPDQSCLHAFEENLDYLCRTLRRLGISPSDVEDLVQDVFIVMHRRWDEYDQSRAVRPWLFGISLRVAAAHLRRVRREVPYAALDFEDRAPRADHLLASEQARNAVVRALGELPLKQRAVVVMHELDGVGMREIAQTLHIPLFTGYSRLRTGRVAFRSAITRLMSNPSGAASNEAAEAARGEHGEHEES